MQNLIATTSEVVHYIALQAVHYNPLQEVHLSRYNHLNPSQNIDVTCEEAIIATLDILARIYDDKTVIDAYYNVDPDTMSLREEDDVLVNLYDKYGLDINNHIQEKE